MILKTRRSQEKTNTTLASNDEMKAEAIFRMRQIGLVDTILQMGTFRITNLLMDVDTSCGKRMNCYVK